MSVAASARRTRKAEAALPAITLTAEGRELRVPASALTLGGFRAWAVSDDFPTRGQLAFIDGELFIDMSPEEISTHALVKGEVGSVLHLHCKKEKLGKVLPDRVLVSNEEAG